MDIHRINDQSALNPPICVERPEFLIKFPANSVNTELVIRDGIYLTEAIAREIRNILVAGQPEKKQLLLVHCEGFFRVSRKVRQLGAKADFTSHLAAVAFYTNNASLSLLGELYNKINKPPTPTRVFTTREAAEEWLLETNKKTVLA